VVTQTVRKWDWGRFVFRVLWVAVVELVLITWNIAILRSEAGAARTGVFVGFVAGQGRGRSVRKWDLPILYFGVWREGVGGAASWGRLAREGRISGSELIRFNGRSRQLGY